MSVHAKMKPAMRRHLISIAGSMIIYGISLTAAEVLVERGGLTGPAAWAIAATPGLCVGALVFFFARLVIEEQDEFIRLLYVRQGAVATVVSLTIAGVWGFLERYVGLPAIEAFWWPTIWCFAMPLGMIYNKITMGTVGGA